MDKLTTQDVTEILVQVTKLICENSDKLCELDSVVGDGDHGTTIQRGVKAAQEKVEANAPEKIDALFSTFAMGMISSMGGASGPIFGSFFQDPLSQDDDFFGSKVLYDNVFAINNIDIYLLIFATFEYQFLL